jgi:hypothetical protein
MTEQTCSVRQALAYFLQVVDPVEDYFCRLLVRHDAVFYNDYSQLPNRNPASHALRALAVELALRHIVHLLSPDESGRDKEIEIRIKRDTDAVDGITVEIECHLARTHLYTAFA